MENKSKKCQFCQKIIKCGIEWYLMVLYSITWLCVALILYKKITKECENRFKGSFYHNTCRVKKINRFFENNLFWDTLMPMLEIQKNSGNDLCHLLQSFCPGTADNSSPLPVTLSQPNNLPNDPKRALPESSH